MKKEEILINSVRKIINETYITVNDKVITFNYLVANYENKIIISFDGHNLQLPFEFLGDIIFKALYLRLFLPHRNYQENFCLNSYCIVFEI